MRRAKIVATIGPACQDSETIETFLTAGIDVARQVFALIDAQVAFEELIADGQAVRRGEVIAWLKGDAASLLQGERVALNLLQRLSGVATLTARFVAAVAEWAAANGREVKP